MGIGNYSATSNNMKLVHWPLMGGLLHLVQRGGDWAGPQLAYVPLRCTKCNSHPLTASVRITAGISPLSRDTPACAVGLTVFAECLAGG